MKIENRSKLFRKQKSVSEEFILAGKLKVIVQFYGYSFYRIPVTILYCVSYEAFKCVTYLFSGQIFCSFEFERKDLKRNVLEINFRMRLNPERLNYCTHDFDYSVVRFSLS